MEIAKHGVAFPPAHQPDGVGIHAATQQRHGATSAQAVGVYVGRAKPDVREGRGSVAEQGGDVVAGDVVPAGAHKVGAQGVVGGRPVERRYWTRRMRDLVGHATVYPLWP